MTLSEIILKLINCKQNFFRLVGGRELSKAEENKSQANVVSVKKDFWHSNGCCY